MLKKWRKKMQRRTGKGNRMDSKKKELYDKNLEDLEDTRKKWEKCKENTGFQKNITNHTLINMLLPTIKRMKQEDLDVFEQIYWEMKTKVTRDEIYANAWAGILSFLTLIIAVSSMFYTLVANSKDVNLISALEIFAAIIMGICLFFVEYVFVNFATRKRSYYKILVSMMEAMMNV